MPKAAREWRAEAMEEPVREIEEALDTFRAMQEAHKQAMGSSGVRDLKTLIFERSRAFADLKEHMSLVLRGMREADGRGFELAPSCKSKLLDIWAAEQELMDQVGEQRSRIAARMGETAGIRKGFKGYARTAAMMARARK